MPSNPLTTEREGKPERDRGTDRQINRQERKTKRERSRKNPEQRQTNAESNRGTVSEANENKMHRNRPADHRDYWPGCCWGPCRTHPWQSAASPAASSPSRQHPERTAAASVPLPAWSGCRSVLLSAWPTCSIAPHTSGQRTSPRSLSLSFIPSITSLSWIVVCIMEVYPSANYIILYLNGSHTHTHTHTLSLTHTHTHTLSLSYTHTHPYPYPHPPSGVF